MNAAAPIRAEGLTKDYGSGNGLFDLDLEVERGEVLGFLGPNGAGKSTTMRLLVDLIRPTRGRASVLGLDSRGDALAIRSRIGYLPGDFALYPQLTGAAVLDYLADLRGGVDPELGAGLADRFGVDPELGAGLADRFGAELDRPVAELSTGNRQKIGLIQAFMHAPELLILDEPIAGLDPLVQQSFHSLLDEVTAAGRTVFLSSHTLSEVERVADRVAILRAGELMVVDSLENLRAIAVQRLEVSFAGLGPDPERLTELDGVREASLSGGHLLVSFEGAADPLVKALAEYRVRSIRSLDDDLEEVFLGYYRGAKR
jgi:ABC-2 type transport system ATP-binding protein